MKHIILASQSPRRKKILEQIGLTIKVVPSEFEEKLNPRLKPRAQTEQLSLEKAKLVAEKYPEAIIIAADTLVYSNGDILGKPKNMEDAGRMIKKLQGKTHIVFTGFTIYNKASKKLITNSAETKVTFRKITDKEIRSYLKIEKPLDKAGGYSMDGAGAALLESVAGDFFNVLGLPVSKVIPALKKFGIDVL